MTFKVTCEGGGRVGPDGSGQYFLHVVEDAWNHFSSCGDDLRGRQCKKREKKVVGNHHYLSTIPTQTVELMLAS